MELPVSALLGYLLGSMPFGLVLTRLAGLGDIRKIGSGNIGATNVLRTGRNGLALATLLCDLLKGAIPTFVAYGWFGPDMAVSAGAGAILGHCFPVWLGFRGGKGVATGGGVLLSAAPWLGAVTAAVWLAMALATRISSAGALAACAAAPLIALLAGRTDLALFSAGVAALVLFRHRPNIERLLAGTEPRFGRGGRT